MTAVCGIVGYVGKRDATPVLIEGLHRLEYRGYDSAGLAVVHRGRLRVTKTAGRVQDLRDKLSEQATKSTIGIGHTRWATHGEPNETNAHPHTDTAGRVAIVHNGIIENAEQLRDQLQANGVRLVTDTDTEALAHMIAAELAEREDVTLEDAVIRTLHRVEGAYGLVVLDIKNPDQLVVARNGPAADVAEFAGVELDAVVVPQRRERNGIAELADFAAVMRSDVE